MAKDSSWPPLITISLRTTTARCIHPQTPEFPGDRTLYHSKVIGHRWRPQQMDRHLSPRLAGVGPYTFPPTLGLRGPPATRPITLGSPSRFRPMAPECSPSNRRIVHESLFPPTAGITGRAKARPVAGPGMILSVRLTARDCLAAYMTDFLLCKPPQLLNSKRKSLDRNFWSRGRFRRNRSLCNRRTTCPHRNGPT